MNASLAILKSYMFILTLLKFNGISGIFWVEGFKFFCMDGQILGGGDWNFFMIKNPYKLKKFYLINYQHLIMVQFQFNLIKFIMYFEQNTIT